MRDVLLYLLCAKIYNILVIIELLLAFVKHFEKIASFECKCASKKY